MPVFVTLFAYVSLFRPPIRGGSRLVSELFLGFVSVFVFELSAVYVPITWIYNMNHVKIGAV